MFIIPFSKKWTTPTVLLAWCALCTTAKPVWFPAVLPKSNANFEIELPYPFDVVLRTWENGPPDPQFLREEVKETRSGYEVEKSKTIYTKNPFPFLIQKTVIRDKELVFIEVQRLNMRQKIAQYWSVNKCMEYVGKAYRTSTIRSHPTKPGYTLIEQAGGVEVNTNVPGALRGPIENFACGAFIDVCKQALNKLNATLQSKHGGATVAPESTQVDDATAATSSGTLQGLGLVLGGLCCKMLLGGSWRGGSTVKEQEAAKARDVAAADARAALPSKPTFTRHTPPFRAAAAAFAVALVSTQLL